MSYCVNCGVELDKSAKKCALCGTPVYNPNEPHSDSAETPFSQKAVVPKGLKQRFVAVIISFFILVPNIVCALINIFFTPKDTWAVFVVSTSFLFWILFVFPFLSKKLHPYLMWGFDSIAAALYIFVFHASNLGGSKWYFTIALPSVAIISLCSLIYINWVRKRNRHWTSKILHIFIDIVVSLTVMCICVLLAGHEETFKVFLICDVSFLALVFFWLYANRSKKLRAYLEKKFFV